VSETGSAAVTEMLFLGVDLAWRESSAERSASDSGVVALSSDGQFVAAGLDRRR
jgi:hypothetical protein